MRTNRGASGSIPHLRCESGCLPAGRCESSYRGAWRLRETSVSRVVAGCGAPFLLCTLLLVSGCATVAQNKQGDQGVSENTTETEELHREGMKAYAAEDLTSAEQSFTKVVERLPDDAQVWFRLGNIYAQTGRPGQAVTAYHHALDADPELAKAWHNLGLVRLRQAVIDFTALTNSVPPEDPLHARGREMSQAIIKLISELPEDDGLDAATGDNRSSTD